jgi:protein AroM
LKKIGILTIGQSPRPDITSDLRRHLLADAVLFETGVLDGFSREYIAKKMCPSMNDVVYVSRMVDGSEVKLAKDTLIPIMQKRIRQLERKKVDLIVIFCTGDFPEFNAKVPLIYAGEVLKGIFSGFKYRQNVGILVPLKEQIDYARKKWKVFFKHMVISFASPYTSTKRDFCVVAKRFKESNVGIIIMDCMGYTYEQKTLIKKCADIAVVSPRSILIRLLNEMLE